MHVTSGPRRFVIGVAGILLATTALAACSSKGTTTTTATANPALGTANKASGTPVKVGFVLDGKTPTIDTSDEAKAATAVVKYANSYLGGIGGRPIDLFTCESKGDVNTDCGQQFVTQKVIAVAGGSLGTTDAVIKPLNAAGVLIPYVDILNQSPGVLGQGGLKIDKQIDFTMSNPLNAFGGAAIYAKKKGVTHAAMIVINVQAAIDPANSLGKLLFGNAGAKLDVVGVSATQFATQMDAAIQAEERQKPGLYHLIGNPAFCAAALKSIKTLGIKTPVTGIDRCLDAASAASIPGGFAGLTVFTPANLDPSLDDTKLYDAIRSTYAGGIATNANFATGYQAILGLIRVLNAKPLTDFTAAGVAAAIKSAPATPIPLGGGATFQCTGKVIFVSPAICSAGGITAEAKADGTLQNFTTIEDPSIYAPPPPPKH